MGKSGGNYIMDQILTLVNTVAFPIAAFIIVFYSWREDQKKYSDERSKWIDALNNNTEIMKDIREVLKK